jgi:hypothetical protein
MMGDDMSNDDKVAAEMHHKLANHYAAENRRLREALGFYARREHWMEIAPDSLLTSLVAMQGDGEQHGWRVAEDALNPTRDSGGEVNK